MTAPVSEKFYEQIIEACGHPAHIDDLARQALADAIAANPIPLMMWLTSEIVETVTFKAPGGIVVTITPKEPGS